MHAFSLHNKADKVPTGPACPIGRRFPLIVSAALKLRREYHVMDGAIFSCATRWCL